MPRRSRKERRKHFGNRGSRIIIPCTRRYDFLPLHPPRIVSRCLLLCPRLLLDSSSFLGKKTDRLGNRMTICFSKAQEEILERCHQGFPCMSFSIHAVAGAGKTTVLLEFIRRHPEWKFLFFTYSSQLRLETREKAESRSLENVEIHSFHSFGVKYMEATCCRDVGMYQWIKRTQGTTPRGLSAYDVIIIDECQDMTPLYHQWILRIASGIRSYHTKLQWILVGDRRQSIFQFNDSNPQYFLSPETFFPGYQFEALHLKETYRCSSSICRFVNSTLYNNKEEVMIPYRGNEDVSSPPCPEVELYWMEEITHFTDLVLIPLIREYGHENIFVLAPSLRTRESNNDPLRHIVAILCRLRKELRISVFVGTQEESSSLDRDLTRGKLVFSTFHRTKGLERDVVVLFGGSYPYARFWRGASQSSKGQECPEILYTVCTRAKKRLLFVHPKDSPFLSWVHPSKFCGVIKTLGTPPHDSPRTVVPSFSSLSIPPPQGQQKEEGGIFRRWHADQETSNAPKHPRGTAVTHICRYLHYRILSQCLEDVQGETTCAMEKKSRIYAKPRVEQPDGLLEYMADLVAISINAYIEWKCSRKITGTTFSSSVPSTALTPLQELWSTALKQDYRSHKFIHRMYQIRRHSLTQTLLDRCFERVYQRWIRGKGIPRFEVKVHSPVLSFLSPSGLESKTVLQGRLDLLVSSRQDSTIYIIELKYTEHLEDTHRLQLMLYRYLYQCTFPESSSTFCVRYFLFNIRSGETWECLSDLTESQIQDIVFSRESKGIPDSSTHSKDTLVSHR